MLIVVLLSIPVLLVATPQIEYVSGNGGTIMEGIVSTNTTWTNTSDPYYVTGNILVHENATLTIDPGVAVKFVGVSMTARVLSFNPVFCLQLELKTKTIKINQY